MSKCDISIEFDAENRTYRGGETVSGRVLVEVNKDLTSNGIKLIHFWQTHGYGNTDSGERIEEMLDTDSQLFAGEVRTYPFSFVADRQPLTYHGHYVNIDHYVRVEVDVPWAIDPKLEEDYVLLAGETPEEVTGKRDEIIEFEDETATQMGPAVKAIIFTLLGGVLLLVAFVAFSLLPIILLVVGIFWVRKKMVSGRLGDVQLKTPHLVVGAGEDWPLELTFTPKKNFLVNGIEVKMSCCESATSGHGTNSTTRTHTVVEKVHVLEPAGQLAANEQFERQVALPFPETDAYSFNGSDNNITWTVEVRIDIPRFPDWKSKQTVQLLPAEFLEEPASGDGVKIESVDREQSDPGTEMQQPADDTAFGIGAPSAEAAEAAAGAAVGAAVESSELYDLIDQVNAADRFGNRREDLVESWSTRELDVVVTVDRVSSTFGSVVDSAYQNGQTVQGTVVETDQSIEVLVRQGGSVDDLSRGDQWRTRVVVAKWDSLYNRLVALDVASR
ncbi:MAG: hypothetical protein VB861_19910 [Planctomycetaceae bacterium]